MIPVWWSVGLTVLGGLGWLLVTLERRIHGFAVGIAAQVAWIAYAVTTAQWGFLGSATLFGIINGIGVHRWWRSRQHAEAVKAHSELLWAEANPGCTCLWSPLHGHERQCPAWSPPSPGLTGLLDHGSTVAMQRADGERALPPVPGRLDVREPVTRDPATDDELAVTAALHEPDLDGMRLLAFRCGWWARHLEHQAEPDEWRSWIDHEDIREAGR